MIRVFILNDKKTCVNVDNDTDAQNLIDNGAFEIQDLSVFNGHENLVSAENTVVNSDGVSVTFSEEKSFDNLKASKLSELANKAQSFEQNVNKDMWFKSSVKGYLINGDRRTRSNIQDLISYQPTDNVIYRDYENIERTLTKDELKIILKEHCIAGEMLYHTKWKLEEQINACTTIEELNAIEIKFPMADFSK